MAYKQVSRVDQMELIHSWLRKILRRYFVAAMRLSPALLKHVLGGVGWGSTSIQAGSYGGTAKP